MSLRNILRLLALRQHIVIVDTLNDGLYEGVVEDVPHDLWDFAVTGMAPGIPIWVIMIIYGSRWINESLILV